MQPSEKREANF